MSAFHALWSPSADDVDSFAETSRSQLLLRCGAEFAVVHYCNLTRRHRAVEACGQPSAGASNPRCSTALLSSPHDE